MRSPSLFSLLSRMPISNLRSMPIPQLCPTAIVTDAAQMVPGAVFVCISGSSGDSHTQISAACKAGACAVILENDAYCAACGTTPHVLVQDSREALSYMLFAQYGNPCDSLCVIGITGTNGKTSVAFYLTQLLRRCGIKCALFSTVYCDIDGVITPATHTTPPPDALASQFAACQRAGVTHVVMEVSSHALDQKRTAAIPFHLGIFTNLTEDHLDYHGGMDAYFKAKSRLFAQCEIGLFNADDPHSLRLIQTPGCCQKQYFYSVASAQADFYASVSDRERMEYELHTPSGNTVRVVMPTIGTFTQYNTLAAFSAASLLGLSEDRLALAAAALHAPAGRMEQIKCALPFPVYIDYAHTPDALEKALRALHEAYPGTPLHLLFGCGGNREKEKRPQMGKIASTLADYTVITSDNSRSESPGAIISDILTGFDRSAPHRIILDRGTAIRHILSCASAPCVILLAGKGHEDYEIDRTGRHPFSEKEQIAAFTQYRSDVMRRIR